MKNQGKQGFKRIMAVVLSAMAVMAVEERAEAQQFRTGAGYVYYTPAQQQYLLALKQRQNAISNYGAAVNLQAARLNAYRKQIESARRAQVAQWQAQLHMQNAMRLQAMQQQQAYWNYVNGRR